LSIVSNFWNDFVALFEYLLLVLFDLTRSSGLAIILLAAIVRLVTLPITYRSMVKMRGMQELQPKLKELQRLHDLDRGTLRRETLKLYREHRTSPLSGCLTMLLQFPLIFAIYQAVTNLTLASATRRLSGSFLWLSDLGQPDPFWILPILLIIIQFALQFMAQPLKQDSFQKMIAYLSLPVPLVFGIVSRFFPSGAVLYWAIDGLFFVLVQYLVSGWGALSQYLRFLPLGHRQGSVSAAVTAVTSINITQDDG